MELVTRPERELASSMGESMCRPPDLSLRVELCAGLSPSFQGNRRRHRLNWSVILILTISIRIEIFL